MRYATPDDDDLTNIVDGLHIETYGKDDDEEYTIVFRGPSCHHQLDDEGDMRHFHSEKSQVVFRMPHSDPMSPPYMAQCDQVNAQLRDWQNSSSELSLIGGIDTIPVLFDDKGRYIPIPM